MKIYHYHPETLEFLNEDHADPDPVDIGNWLIPAHSTTVPPLPNQENQIVCFKDGVWVYQDKIEQEPYDPTANWTYADHRAMEYPPITDYLDAIVKNDQEQIDQYIAECLAVKEKYPKQ